MRRRLALTALATTAMVTIAFVVPLAVLIRTVAADRALRAAEQEAQSLVAVLATSGDDPSVAAAVVAGAGDADRVVTVFRADGSVLGAPAVEDESVLGARAGRAFTADADGGRAVFVPVVGAGGATDVIRVFVPDTALRRGVVRSWVLLGGLGIGLVALGVAVADRLGRSVVRPMADAADVAHRLGQGDLDARVGPAGPPEVVAVGEALNMLAGRIRSLLAAEREGVADLSHRLRTPLAALRLEAEALPDGGAAERLVAATDDVTRAVDQLIAEARRPLRRDSRAVSDLTAIVRDRVAFWAPLAEDEGRSVTVVVPPGRVPVAVPPDDIGAALDALVSNVLAHTPPGTPFAVELVDGADGAVLTIADEGPGLADPKALARGVSGAGSTGLGLDIVRRTAEAAGGRLHLGAGPGGRGTSVRLELPVQR